MTLAYLAALAYAGGGPVRAPRRASDDNTHHRRVISKPYHLTLHGRPISGHVDVASALRRLAVLNRDGELPGFELIARGAR